MTEKEELKYNEAYDCTVSSLGYIIRRGKKITPTKRHNTGYYVVRDGKNVLRRIHRMVAGTFIPNPKPDIYTDVNHKDGDKSNNEVSNLEWCSRSKNIKHAYDTGLREKKKGEDSPNAKITIEQAQWIYDNYQVIDGKSNGPQLAKQFNVNPSTIRSIITGRSGDGRPQWENVVRNREIPKLTHTGGPRKVAQIDVNTGEVIAIFNTIKEGIQKTGVKTISQCASGHAKTAGGYKWQYIDE